MRRPVLSALQMVKVISLLLGLALCTEEAYHSEVDHSEEPPSSHSRLEWYLPISANSSFGFHPTHEMLVISTEYSIAGINITDGAYRFNSTFYSRSVCTKLVNQRLVTLSDTNHVGQWTTLDGFGTDWIQISNYTNPRTERFCDILSPTPDLTVVLHHGKEIICFDEEGNQLWTWTCPDSDVMLTKLEYTSDYIVAVGTTQGKLKVYDFTIEEGRTNYTMQADVNLKSNPEFITVGHSPLYLVWLDGTEFHGYDIENDIKLDFSFFVHEVDDFEHAPKRLIQLDTEFNRQHNFVVEYLVNNEFHYVLVTIQLEQEETNVFYNYLPPTPTRSVFAQRDNNQNIEILGRVYVDEGENVFEFLNTRNGEVVQHYVLEALFPGIVQKAFLHTWMINEKYFHWNLVGQDDQGGFLSHRMPTVEVDANGTIESDESDAQKDAQSQQQDDEYQEYHETNFVHEEL